jgi:NADPH:quinone reductase-like Zn-dependent oxidoreductase
MRAFVLPDASGEAGFGNIPVPDPEPGEIRVAMQASSVNAFDVDVAAGAVRDWWEHRYPVVIGKDFAGVVDAMGEQVDRFAVGDEVAGVTPTEEFVHRGTYAEFVCVPAEGFTESKPQGLSFEQAASVGLASLGALASVGAAEISQDDVVLVAGATGGVGAYAVQLASGRGRTVIATGLPEDEEWLRGLGASEVVDYREDVAAAVRASHPDGVDALVDAVNRDEQLAALTEVVKEGGNVASTTNAADEEALRTRGIGATKVFGQADPALFARALAMAGAGELEVPIRETFTFDELPQALGLTGQRSGRGKAAISIG